MNIIETQLNNFEDKYVYRHPSGQPYINGGEKRVHDIKVFIKESMELMAKSVIDDIPNGCDSDTCEKYECIEPDKQQLRDKYLTPTDNK